MPLFAVIDGAADPTLYPALLTEQACQSLFAPPLDPDLAPVTPHLVELRPDSLLPGRMQGAGRAGNWGLLCAAPGDFATVRKALRRNLQAMLPDGRLVLFRFYDPRVFVPYLESCDAEALKSWFDPVTDWWAPQASGLVHFHRSADGGLRRELRGATN
jgi:hypothetical protein